ETKIACDIHLSYLSILIPSSSYLLLLSLPQHKVDDVNEYNDDFQQNIIDEDDFQQNIIDEDDFQQIITDKDDDFQEIITDKDDNGDKASDEDICEDDSYTTQRKFVESDGIKRTCATHSDCYDQREPSSWCDLNEN
ncbi:unnamed protein product, partial [Onchocerca ochengi]|uniref:Sortilin-related receptor n=1 Tax=Onchocerca ochengi TaxID=42157 RepID=A0A182EZ30_ONCOC